MFRTHEVTSLRFSPRATIHKSCVGCLNTAKPLVTTGFRRPSDNTWVVTNGFAVFKHPTQDLWIVAEGENRRDVTSWSINTTAPPAGGAAYPLANNAAVPSGTSQVFIRGVSNSVYIHPATGILELLLGAQSADTRSANNPDGSGLVNARFFFTGSYTCLLYTSPSPRD